MGDLEPDVFLALAMLSQAGSDLRESFDRFARLAQTTWPEVATVERQGFFSRGPIHRVVLRLPSRAYIARREGLGLVFEVGAMSQGVIIKVNEVALASWCDAFRSDVERVTGQSVEAQQFLDAGAVPTDTLWEQAPRRYPKDERRSI